jgi:chemotaxis protein methyltransferase CheR
MAFTFFFRDQQTLDLLAEHALPVLTQNRYIRIWDAGCAMGPEPYSLAMIFREHMGKFLFRNLRISATDIDESDFGRVIGRGVYPEEQLKRIPPDIFQRYFEPDDEPGCFRLIEEIRQAVQFQRHDLLSLQPVRADFGLIVCKNVLLHFTPEQRVAVIKMFHAALVDNGFFVTEQTQKMPPECDGLFRQLTQAAQIFQKIPLSN